MGRGGRRLYVQQGKRKWGRERSEGGSRRWASLDIVSDMPVLEFGILSPKLRITYVAQPDSCRYPFLYAQAVTKLRCSRQELSWSISVYIVRHSQHCVRSGARRAV